MEIRITGVGGTLPGPALGCARQTTAAMQTSSSAFHARIDRLWASMGSFG